jgi:hypothetical protein
MNDQERREAERIRFTSRIIIKTENDTLGATADSRNISLKGMYVLPEKMLPLKTPCMLDITLMGDTSKMTISIPGRVCRHDEKGMGIAFTEMKVDSFIHIKNLIKLHSSKENNIE